LKDTAELNNHEYKNGKIRQRSGVNFVPAYRLTTQDDPGNSRHFPVVGH
jgi:hypothetical protein